MISFWEVKVVQYRYVVIYRRKKDASQLAFDISHRIFDYKNCREMTYCTCKDTRNWQICFRGTPHDPTIVSRGLVTSARI